VIEVDIVVSNVFILVSPETALVTILFEQTLFSEAEPTAFEVTIL
jgi:hypothetical protein